MGLILLACSHLNSLCNNSGLIEIILEAFQTDFISA